MFGFDGTPYKLFTRVHRNAHKFARDFLEANLETRSTLNPNDPKTN